MAKKRKVARKKKKPAAKKAKRPKRKAPKKKARAVTKRKKSPKKKAKKAAAKAGSDLIARLPFRTAQKVFNTLYYERGEVYSKDFFTFATSVRVLAESEAKDFYFYLVKLAEKNKLPHKIRVLELGGGNGNSAAFFLKEFKKQDREHKTLFHKRVSYTLLDFSDKMLDSVKHNPKLKQYRKQILLVQADAGKPMPLEPGAYTYVRFNELYDDLPTDLLLLEQNKLYEVFLDVYLDSRVKVKDRKGNNVSRHSLAHLMKDTSIKLRDLNPEFVKKLELEVKYEPAHSDLASFLLLSKELGPNINNLVIPFPYTAAENLAQLKEALTPEGRIDFFDYGFVSLKGLKQLQSGIFRTPGALTTFVNIPFLRAIARIAGFGTVLVEPQAEYFKRIKKGVYTHDLKPKKKPGESKDAYYHVYLKS